jgi:predicted nucleic acid-binding protein
MRHVYWDSCIAIYRVERVEPWAWRLEQAIAALGDDWSLHVSELTRLECRVGPLIARHAELTARYDEFFSRQELVYAALDRRTFDLAAQLRAVHRLKTPDALHLAAAIASGCDEIWTNDHRLDAAAASTLKVVIPADRS